jgi:putative endopeptidase
MVPPCPSRRLAWRILAAALVVCGAAPLAAQYPAPVGHDSAGRCAACADFYTWANRAWLDTATIPPARAEWGAWSANDERVLTQLRATLVAAAAAPHPTSLERTLARFDAGCMDSARAERDGIAPLRPALNAIEAIRSRDDVARVLARLHRDGILALFTLSSEVDRVGDLRYMATLESDRLPLDAGSYSGVDAASAARRASFRDHARRTLMLAGEPEASAARDADVVLAIDGALARASMTYEQQANATLQDMFRHESLARLERAAPAFWWRAYLRGRGAPPVDTLIVQEPAYFATLGALLASHPVADWRAYLRWRAIDAASPFLSSAFVRESFAWSSKGNGATALAPRWQRCVRETNADLPELLGRAYVARDFPPSSRARIDTMVASIRAVLVDRLARVPWLTEATRRQSLAKARAFHVKIGYPDAWHDVSALHVAPGAFLRERADARRFEADRMMRRIGRRVDRREWDYHSFYHFIPQSPTAWANWDEIIFPAAYLQPPLYDSTANMAANYGGIGVVIAHEMTHLFTADGGDIDAEGRARHWWTAADSQRFAVIQQRLIRQFDQYTVVDSATHVNGALTLGENLADLGGFELAYAALERALPEKSRRATAPGDTTPEMRFFLSYAHFRVSKARPEQLRAAVKWDGHAPSMYRTNGPLSNFDGFAATFGCSPGDPMVRPDSVRVRIW